MNHELFEDLVAGQAFGSLSAEDKQALDAHLASACPRCRELTAAFTRTTASLSSAADNCALPRGLKQRIMDEIAPAPARLPQTAWWMRGALALAACAVVAILVPSLIQKPVIGRATQVKGHVLINNKPATENAVIRQGQTITTDVESTVEIWLKDLILIKVEPISNASLNQANSGFQMDLHKGSAISLVKTGTPYAVATATLKAEARGTGFFVETHDKAQTYVCICTGHIVISKGDFRQDMEASHHKAMVATEQAGYITTTPGTMIGHSDQEIADLLTRFK